MPAAVLQGGLGGPFGADGRQGPHWGKQQPWYASCCAAGRTSPHTMQRGEHSPGKVATQGICTHRCAGCCAAGQPSPQSSPACCRSQRSRHCSLAAGHCTGAPSDVLGLRHSAKAAGVPGLLTAATKCKSCKHSSPAHLFASAWLHAPLHCQRYEQLIQAQKLLMVVGHTLQTSQPASADMLNACPKGALW